MKPLGIVLAGLGVRGRHWAEVLTRSPRTEILAYVDPNPAAVERAAALYGERPAYTSVEDALAATPGVGGRVLAHPPIGRAAQVRATASARSPSCRPAGCR